MRALPVWVHLMCMDISSLWNQSHAELFQDCWKNKIINSMAHGETHLSAISAHPS